jgi:hypothetical protein
LDAGKGLTDKLEREREPLPPPLHFTLPRTDLLPLRQTDISAAYLTMSALEGMLIAQREETEICTLKIKRMEREIEKLRRRCEYAKSRQSPTGRGEWWASVVSDSEHALQHAHSDPLRRALHGRVTDSSFLAGERGRGGDNAGVDRYTPHHGGFLGEAALCERRSTTASTTPAGSYVEKTLKARLTVVAEASPTDGSEVFANPSFPGMLDGQASDSAFLAGYEGRTLDCGPKVRGRGCGGRERQRERERGSGRGRAIEREIDN